MCGWNAKISLGSLVVMVRLTAASGLLGWFLLMMTAHIPQDPTAGEQVSQPPQLAPPEVSDERPAAAFSFSTAGGWITPDLPPAGVQSAPQDGAGPSQLPKLPANNTSRADEMNELLALRARVGTGLGDTEAFQAALAALFEQEGQGNAGSESAGAGTRPQPIVLSEVPAAPQLPPSWQPNSHPAMRQHPRAFQPVELQSRAQPFGVPYQPLPPGASGPSAAATAHIRLAGRAIEEAAWQLEQVGEYELADDLRQQAQKVYLRARRLQAPPPNPISH